jgi:hypothetical protein
MRDGTIEYVLDDDGDLFRYHLELAFLHDVSKIALGSFSD